MLMQLRFRVALFGLLVVSAAHAADAAGCSVHKGLYDSWLALAKQASNRPAKGVALVASGQTPAVAAPSAQGIANEYRNFFSFISEAAIPGGDDASRSLCKDAATDRVADVACQAALYL